MKGADGVIRAVSGRLVHVWAPSVLDVAIGDIARGLANVARFNGQTADARGALVRYTVAQHSRLVAEFVIDHVQSLATHTPAGVATLGLAALLHDAPEAYIGDLVRPIKQIDTMAPFREAEARLLRAVYRRFDVCCDTVPDVVAWFDDVALELEGRQFVPGWDRIRPFLPCVVLEAEPSDVAERRFLETFAALERMRLDATEADRLLALRGRS